MYPNLTSYVLFINIIDNFALSITIIIALLITCNACYLYIKDERRKTLKDSDERKKLRNTYIKITALIQMGILIYMGIGQVVWLVIDTYQNDNNQKIISEQTAIHCVPSKEVTHCDMYYVTDITDTLDDKGITVQLSPFADSHDIKTTIHVPTIDPTIQKHDIVIVKKEQNTWVIQDISDAI